MSLTRRLHLLVDLGFCTGVHRIRPAPRQGRISADKVPRGTNSKTTAAGELERPPVKYHLPTKSKQQQGRRNANRPRKQNGRRPSRAVNGSSSSSNTAVLMSRPLFPIKTTRTLQYHEAGAVSGAGGSVGTYVFSTNGLYDPNITGTGHQPSGFDQIMLFYEHYFVVRAEMVVTFHNVSTTISPMAVLSVCGSATPITVVNQLMEDGSSVRTQLAVSTVDGNMKTLRLSCNVAKFGGVDDLSDASEYQGSIAANPVEASYFHLSVFDQEALGTANVQFDVNVRYTATFIEPRDVSPSLQKQIDALVVKSIKALALETKSAERHTA